MTTINPTGAGNGPLISRESQTLGITLDRIGKALTVRDGKASDSVQISSSASNAAGAAGNANLRTLLADLEEIVAAAAKDNAGAEVRAEAQRRIDEAAGVISEVAGLRGSEGAGALDGGGQFAISNQHAGVSELKINSELGFRERVDVEIVVTQSAQRAGLFLSLGGPSIDLGTGSSFVFEIGGVSGSRSLSFASGTNIVDMSAAINTFSDVTGVQASISGTGIRISSIEASDSALVTVKVIEDGSISSGDGIHGLVPGDASLVDTALISSYSAAGNSSETFSDVGQGASGTINGQEFSSSDSSFSVSLLDGRLSVEGTLNTFDFWKPLVPSDTPFRAFTIIGGAQTGVEGPIDEVPIGGSSPLAPFTSSGQQAGEFAAALDAIRSYQDQLGAPVSDDFLADIRRDLINSVGTSLGTDVTTEQQRTLDLLGGSKT